MANRPNGIRVRSNDLGYHDIPAGQRGSSYGRQKRETNEGGENARHGVEEHVGRKGWLVPLF